MVDVIGQMFSGVAGYAGMEGEKFRRSDPFTAALQASLAAQKDANALAAFASRPAIDSESARAAGDERRRKLLSGSNFGIGLPDLLGEAPVGFRLLSGQ